MNFEFSDEEKQFRKEVSEYVRQELPPDLDKRAMCWPGGYGTAPFFEGAFPDVVRPFFQKIGKKGWLTLGWPREYGGMNSMVRQAIVDEVLSYYYLPLIGAGSSIVGPTIIHFGSAEMKKKWLPGIAAGEITFWLGYSEPNAGSDLGNVKIAATQDGEDYLINGQKTWSSGAHVHDYCFLLARTDRSKYKGLTLFIVPSDSPGITKRTVVNICGRDSFNEVFFDNVRVPHAQIVGKVNEAFGYIVMSLQWERLASYIGGIRRVLEELIEYTGKTTVNGVPLSKQPLVRNKLSLLAIEIETVYGLYWRTAWLMDQADIPEIEASAFKLFWTELGRKVASAAMEILGPLGQLETGSKWAPLNGRVALGYLDGITGPIGAGTSEVMRNIIATRGLGLPRQ